MPRCICKTMKKLRCKNPICAFSQCWTHLNQKYYYHIITIQRIWVGFRIRKLYNTIYKRLPTELQHKILFYIRENFLVKKYHHNIIGKIMHKKIENGFKNISVDRPIDNINNLSKIYILVNKYFTTLNSNDVTLLLKKGTILIHQIDRQIFADDFFEDIMFCVHKIAIFVEKYKNFVVL